MKNKEIRVRFAPSPTGFMHLGNARTALFNYLFVRNQGGKFILRVEDTDYERSTEEAIEVIFSSLNYLGINWDEGPYYQSKRLGLYRDYALKLLSEGYAYRCFCLPEEIAERKKRVQDVGGIYKYDRHCLKLNEEDLEQVRDRPYAVRFLVPHKEVGFKDLIRGEISFQGEEIEDFVLLRSDGTPTYNFACVVDDHLLNISHVIRGEDHIPNTPKQILIYQALNWELPQFAHLPMILGPDYSKLSKRHGATSVEAYQRGGYLPQALFNYLALLGASYEPDREVYSKEELIKLFSLDKVSKKAAVFDPEKLKWMNKEHLRMMKDEDLADLMIEREYLKSVEDEKVYETFFNRVYLLKVMRLIKERLTLLSDVQKEFAYFFKAPNSYDLEGLKKYKVESVLSDLKSFLVILEGLEDFSAAQLEEKLREFAERLGLKARDLIHPLRIALTGKTVSPGLFELMEVLGKNETISRINLFLGMVENREQIGDT